VKLRQLIDTRSAIVQRVRCSCRLHPIQGERFFIAQQPKSDGFELAVGVEILEAIHSRDPESAQLAPGLTIRRHIEVQGAICLSFGRPEQRQREYRALGARLVEHDGASHA
jgi:hypothetical protein